MSWSKHQCFDSQHSADKLVDQAEQMHAISLISTPTVYAELQKTKLLSCSLPVSNLTLPRTNWATAKKQLTVIMYIMHIVWMQFWESNKLYHYQLWEFWGKQQQDSIFLIEAINEWRMHQVCHMLYNVYAAAIICNRPTWHIKPLLINYCCAV